MLIVQRTVLGIVALAALAAAPTASRLEAGTIPLQEAWESLDGPQPHGPGLLFDHQPYNSGGLTSDSMGFEEPGATIVYQYVADDFVLPFDAQIRRVVFFGFYNTQVLPIGDETFQINVHEPRMSDGLPGDVVFSETVVNPVREWTGRDVISAAGGREYRFEVDIAAPLFLLGGETNWLSIYQVGDPFSSFRWEASLGPVPWNGQAALNAVFPDWALYPEINTAFQLYSAPEASSLALVFVGALTLTRFRGHRTFR